MTDDSQRDKGAGAGGPRRSTDQGGGPTAAAYAGLGLQLFASILLFLYAGQWLDRRFGTKGICTVIGVLFGAGAAFYGIYRRLTAEQRRDDGGPGR